MTNTMKPDYPTYSDTYYQDFLDSGLTPVACMRTYRATFHRVRTGQHVIIATSSRIIEWMAEKAFTDNPAILLNIEPGTRLEDWIDSTEQD